MQNQSPEIFSSTSNQPIDTIEFMQYVVTLWNKRWLVIVIFLAITIVALPINIFAKPTFQSVALIKVATYQNTAIESLADLQAVIYSAPALELLGKQLGIDTPNVRMVASLFDINQKKTAEKDGLSSYWQINGRANSPEKAQATVIAVCDAIIARHAKLFSEALTKFNLEVELLKREKQTTGFLIKQKQQELTQIKADMAYYENEIKKRDKANSEAQGRIVESYINLLAGAKVEREKRVVEIENLNIAFKNFDVKFQQKDFERKYQTKATSIEVSADLPQAKVSPNIKKNMILSSIMAAFIAVLAAFVSNAIGHYRSEEKIKIGKTNKEQTIVTPSAL